MNEELKYNFKSICVKEKMHLKREKSNNIYFVNTQTKDEGHTHPKEKRVGIVLYDVNKKSIHHF